MKLPGTWREPGAAGGADRKLVQLQTQHPVYVWGTVGKKRADSAAVPAVQLDSSIAHGHVTFEPLRHQHCSSGFQDGSLAVDGPKQPGPSSASALLQRLSSWTAVWAGLEGPRKHLQPGSAAAAAVQLDSCLCGVTWSPQSFAPAAAAVFCVARWSACFPHLKLDRKPPPRRLLDPTLSFPLSRKPLRCFRAEPFVRRLLARPHPQVPDRGSC